MSEEESGWFDSVVDSVGEYAEDAGQWIDEQLDTDSDGSIVDNVLGGGAELLGFDEYAADLEEVGDGITDGLGTRMGGLLGEETTWTADTADTEYADGQGDGYGAMANEYLDLGETDLHSEYVVPMAEEAAQAAEDYLTE